MKFISPTRGKLDFDRMFEDIVTYMHDDSDAHYNLIVGTDSQFGQETCFVSAIIIHRQGKGGRYYYTRHYEFVSRSLRQRIFYETSKSLSLAGLLAERLAENGYADLNVQIHLDVGVNGETRDLIREVVGMVIGSGFDARIKPESFGASTVADRYTK